MDAVRRSFAGLVLGLCLASCAAGDGDTPRRDLGIGLGDASPDGAIPLPPPADTGLPPLPIDMGLPPTPPPPVDTGMPPPPADLGLPPMDLGAEDAGPAPIDMSVVDSGPADTGPRDMGVTDTGPRDMGADAGPPPPMCPRSPCDLELQDCPLPNACDYAVDDTGSAVTYCRPAGPRRDGELCESQDDCREGLTCVGTSPTTTVCRPMCCEMNDAICPAGQFCRVTLVDADGAPTGVQLCDGYEPCDVLDSTGCPSGQQCYPSAEDGSTDCADPGTSAEGDACAFQNSCLPGHICIGGGQCGRICSVGGVSPDCPMGQTCRGGFAGFPDLGICDPIG